LLLLCELSLSAGGQPAGDGAVRHRSRAGEPTFGGSRITERVGVLDRDPHRASNRSIKTADIPPASHRQRAGLDRTAHVTAPPPCISEAVEDLGRRRDGGVGDRLLQQ